MRIALSMWKHSAVFTKRIRDSKGLGRSLWK